MVCAAFAMPLVTLSTGQGSRRPLSELIIPLTTTMGDLREGRDQLITDPIIVCHIHDNRSSKAPGGFLAPINRFPFPTGNSVHTMSSVEGTAMTAKRIYLCKLPACSSISGRSEDIFKPLVSRLRVREVSLALTLPGKIGYT
ncbi:hypothetical protein J6590_084742 [Homalodisca vitripennis]|nr:hypothetical protein J6590_084741 [Homalodisca vitripennis]KAG8246460.1 hypothetical protein J6590_084742 [Homalodisca vitripennis]